MEETYRRIISELETLNKNPQPISEPTLQDLQSLFENDTEELIDQLLHKNLSPTSLLEPLSSSMDSGPPHLTLLASNIYLSILLTPNSPVLMLFTPIVFLSLLRSLRRCFKYKHTGLYLKLNNKKRGKGDMRFDYRLLFPLLEKLYLVLCKVHLHRFPDSLKSLVQTVSEIPVSALEFYDNLGTYTRLTDLCYKILSGLLRPEHGNETDTAVQVLKALTPSILLLKSQARTCALRFVREQMILVAKANVAVRKAIVYLPRYLVSRAPERSEPRAAAVESIMEVVRAMELEDQIGFVEYVIKLSQGKANLRLLAVDLIPMLLMALPDPLGLNVEDEGKDWWGLRCLEVLINRCSDLNAASRAKALSNVAQVLEYFSGDVRCRDRLKKILGFRNAGGGNSEGGLTALLRKRCMDEKANVRKSALLLIAKSTALFGGSVDSVLLKTMGIACSDPLVSIRKAAISALSEAFRKFSDECVIIEWLHSVPCLITDNESSIQEECQSLFLELVLDRLSIMGAAGSAHSIPPCSSADGQMRSLNRDMESVFPGGVLFILKGLCDSEVMPCIKKICMSLGKKKRLKPAIAVALQNIIKTSESLWLTYSMPIEKWTAPAGTWLLLSEVSSFLPKAVDWDFLHHHWQLLDKSDLDNGIESPFIQSVVDGELEDIESNSAAWARDRVCLLQTISNVSVELPPEPAAELAHNLLKRLEEFSVHSTEDYLGPEIISHYRMHVPTVWRRLFCTTTATSPTDFYVETDYSGGSENLPSGYAVRAVRAGITVAVELGSLSCCPDPGAGEMAGVLQASRLGLQLGGSRFPVYCDNEIVVALANDQNGYYPKSENILHEAYNQLSALLRDYKLTVHHVKSVENPHAHFLARQARRILGVKVFTRANFNCLARFLKGL